MPKQTPFHSRLEPLNQTGVWKNWSGYLVAPRYQYSTTTEYYAIRNSVALLDTSPLFKYKFSGSDAERLLSAVLARDIQDCGVNQAQYTVWCDERGFVVQDGVVIRTSESEFWLTAAEPSLRYFRQHARRLGLSDVSIEDVSELFGILALQGPHAFSVLGQLSDEVASLGYFEVAQTRLADADVVVSRTGYTGDLGYEIWVKRDDALAVWDALVAAGDGFNLTPIGTTALKMARVEAGLLLMGVDFDSSRFAWVDEQRESPIELGMRWMLKGIEKKNRDFVGRQALIEQMESKSNRWVTVGLAIDACEYESAYRSAGILPPKQEVYLESTLSLYRRGDKQWDYAGYASSLVYSSLLKKPIAIAKLPAELGKVGTEVDIELTVIRKPVNVLARVQRLPFFEPKRKTASVAEALDEQPLRLMDQGLNEMQVIHSIEGENHE